MDRPGCGQVPVQRLILGGSSPLLGRKFTDANTKNQGHALRLGPVLYCFSALFHGGLGAVAGYPGAAVDGNEEFFNVRGITTVNMENQELKDSASTITVIYKQYIQ